MYLWKINPMTTCLYSAASILDRNLSAASHSLASKPMLAAVDSLFAAFLAMCLVDQGLVVTRRQDFVRGGLYS